MVGKAEQILNETFNSTLSEWTTDTDNYLNNGKVISEVFKEAVYNIDVYAAMGHYNFDKKTKRNTNGFKPTMFYQPRFIDGNLNTAFPVSYYDDNANEIHPVNNGFLFGGSINIPIGRVKTIEFEVEIIDRPTFIVISTLASLGIILSVICFVWLVVDFPFSSDPVKIRWSVFKHQDIAMTIGLTIFLTSVLATPNGQKRENVETNYICQGILLVIGLSIMTTATIWKILKTNPANRDGTVKRKLDYICWLWPLIQTTLIVAFVGVGSFAGIKAIHLESFYSGDRNTVYKPCRYQYGTDFLTKSGSASFGLFIAIAILNVLALLFCLFKSYRCLKLLKSVVHRHPNGTDADLLYQLEDFKMASIGVVFITTLICGTVLIGLISINYPNQIVLLIPISVLTISFGLILINFLAKFTSHEIKAGRRSQISHFKRSSGQSRRNTIRKPK